MAGKMDYQLPQDLGTVWAYSADFFGCCGAINWYLCSHSVDQVLKSDLAKLADKYKDRKSVAQVILSGSELSTHEHILLEFGFVKVWGNIVNVNSQNTLHGYILDLNTYRQKTLTPLKKLL